MNQHHAALPRSRGRESIRSVGQLCSVPSRELRQLWQIRKIHSVKWIRDASHRMRRAGPSKDDGESKNRDDQTRADYKDALQHLTRIRSATAGGVVRACGLRVEFHGK